VGTELGTTEFVGTKTNNASLTGPVADQTRAFAVSSAISGC
jgi:hypothetical protein